MNASILGQSMSKANEQSFDMYSGEYIDFLKSLRIRKSEKWNTKIRKPRNELKFDKGFFSSSWLDKETGEPFSGWGEQNHENGNIKKEWFFDEGVMLYQAFYFPNGQLKDEQYLSGTKRHGPALGYYKNGTQRFVAYFVNGEKWLPTINYYENGNIKGNFLYWNGKEAGYANSFHENGELHDQTLFGKSPDPEYISLISDGSSNKPKRKVRDDGGEVIGRVFCKDNGLKHVEEDWSRMDDHRGFTGKLMVRTALRMYDKNGALEYDTAGLEMKTRKRKSSFKKGYIWVKVPKDDKVGYENVKKRTSVKKEALKDKSAINLEDFIQENHDPLKLRIKLSNLQKGPDGSCIICNAEDRKTYYKGKRFTGTWFHSKKGMFFEREVVEGITDGRDEAWNSKGVKRKTQFYKAGRAHGLARTWDDSGKIIESKYFIKGKEVNEKDWNRHQKNQ
jgi:antitoxin component YwqK of YwqJK toxin-antitoxin module